MRNRYLAGFLGVLLLNVAAASAQEPLPVKQHIPDKPFYFDKIPDKVYCETSELDVLFQSPSTSVAIHLANGSLLRGTVAEKVQRGNGITSVNLRLSEFANALFNLTYNEHTNKYAGRIVHPRSGDVLILTEENGRYYLRKQQQKFFMTE